MAERMENQSLFKTKLIPGKAGSGKLFEEEFVPNDRPVECLGMTFENDEKRREYFLEKLREKLKDPEFRNIEGFPIGEDEDILALSDPPYYTACPNPFIADFIKHYGKPYDPETDDYRREPFAADIGAGKTHPVYTAHSYHSKIPHLATMPCILHYTEPGDIVLDGFSGSGMTGVAAQLCGQPEPDFKAQLEEEWKEERFRLTAGTEEGVWDFVRTHLKQLPVFVSKDGKAEVIAERQNYLLFDRMVAFHVQRGVTAPLSAAEFYTGLAQRFPERDGMYFLPDQAAEYDKKRMTVKEVLQLSLFVTDEASAIQWLKQQLTRKPQTFQELDPQFLKEIGGWQKHEKPLELSELLEQNFLRYNGKGSIPAQIVSWMKQSAKLRELISCKSRVASGESKNAELETRNPELLRAAKDRWYVPDPNKAGDLEKLRERTLLREFEEYRESKQKRLKVFRLEAVRAGFKKAWQERDYATIIAVAHKIPEKILQEDPKLLMWYDQAVTRTGGET